MNKLVSFFSHAASKWNQKKYFSLRRKYYKTNSKLMSYIYTYKIRKIEAKNGGYIGLLKEHNVFSGSMPKFVHGIRGVFISKEATIGNDCIIFQNVTIGRNEKGLAPTIGDNVLIGANAVIVGGVKIGSNVKIGAGCVVSIDIPDNSVAVMNHPRILDNKNTVIDF